MSHVPGRFFLTSLMLCVNVPIGAEQPDDPAVSKRRLEMMYQIFSGYELQFADDAERSLPRTKEPILRWSNPVRNDFSDGATYLWLNDARPVAVATISIQGRLGVWREFSTLTNQPLQAVKEGQVFWNPSKGNLVLQPLKRAPAPAASARLRLSQMRKLAEQFRVTMHESESKLDEVKDLRLLPQPVYQWSSKAPAVSQGAVFAFCETTDPEAVLTLELYADKQDDPPLWRYTLVRMTSRPLTFYHDEQEIGSAKGYWSNPRTRQDPYAARREADFESE